MLLYFYLRLEIFFFFFFCKGIASETYYKDENMIQIFSGFSAAGNMNKILRYSLAAVYIILRKNCGSSKISSSKQYMNCDKV